MSKGLINEILNNIADLTNLQTGEVEIDIGDLWAIGRLSTSSSQLGWTIPLGRTLPKNTTVTKITGNIVARAGNHNAGGLYFWRLTEAMPAVFDTSVNSTFLNGANVSTSILPSYWVMSIEGNTNLKIDIISGTNYFFTGDSTNNGYCNNQPCVLELSDIKVTVDIPTQSIYVPNATITLDAPNTTVVNNGSPIPGTIQMYAGSIAPEGFLICDGSAINRIDYSVLFNIIGLTYGAGDGVTTFNIPDLRGRVPLGAGIGTAESATLHTLGDLDGEELHTHQVGMKFGSYYYSPNLESTQYGFLDLRVDQSTIGTSVSAGSETYLVPNVLTSASKSITGGTVKKLGYTTIENSMQPYLAINYIIATGKND